MMTNLFSIFDPSTSIWFSFNWVSSFLWIIVMPVSLWFMNNRVKKLKQNIFMYLVKEFNMILFKNPQILLFMISILIFILLNNINGLLPNIFTSTSHISISFTMSLPMWLGLFMISWGFNMKNMLTHLIPTDTPFLLMPMMVLIEMLSSLIQPLTLAIRLMANMTAGHLILSILMEASSKILFIYAPVLMSVQIAITGLEVAVAMIQAYVFTILMTIYTSNTMI